jgi:hypothetical protein
MLQPTSKILCLLGWRPTGDLADLTAYTSKRGKVVWFLKAPPTTPPTVWQLRQRNRFRLCAYAWKALRPEVRSEWNNAAQRGRLYCTGLNLWMFWNLTRDSTTIRTIQRQTGTTLIY